MTVDVWLRVVLLLVSFVALLAVLSPRPWTEPVPRIVEKQDPTPGSGRIVEIQDLTARRMRGDPEASRKLLHVGSGVLTLTFPFTFDDLLPVLVLTMAAAGVMGAVRIVRPLRERFGPVVHGVARTSYGDLYFPIAIAVLYFASHTRPLLFVVPVLTLTFADAAGALVGGRLGRIGYVGSDKTVAGSIAFAAVAFACAYLPVVAVTDLAPNRAACVALIFAISTAVVEACCRHGADNIVVPLAGYSLLEACLGMPSSALAAQSIMTTALGGLLCLQTFWYSRPASPIHRFGALRG